MRGKPIDFTELQDTDFTRSREQTRLTDAKTMIAAMGAPSFELSHKGVVQANIHMTHAALRGDFAEIDEFVRALPYGSPTDNCAVYQRWASWQARQKNKNPEDRTDANNYEYQAAGPTRIQGVMATMTVLALARGWRAKLPSYDAAERRCIDHLLALNIPEDQVHELLGTAKAEDQ